MEHQHEYKPVLVPGQAEPGSVEAAVREVEALAASNTPALVTRASVSVDWLAFVVTQKFLASFRYDARLVLDELGLPIDWSAVEDTGHGGEGYQHKVNLDLPGGYYCYGGQGDTLRVVLTAQSLSYLVHVKKFDLWGWLVYLVSLKDSIRFRRFDVAFDDYEGVLTWDNLRAAIMGRDIVSRFKNTKNPYCAGSAPFGGEDFTVGFGSRCSDSFVRFYNKKAERAAKGAEVHTDYWFRCEVEFKHDKTDKIVRDWVESDFSVPYLVGLLRGVIDFRVNDGDDKNQTRWAVVDWWARFLGLFEAVRVRLPKVHKTIQDVFFWAYSQVGPSLALINDILGEGVISRIIGDGRDRFGPRHRIILNAGKGID